MPNEQYDLLLGADPPKGFMLARGRAKGRAWRRVSVPSIPGGSSPSESRFGTTSPEIAFREVFDDFSGGDGYAYRGAAPPNAIHWSENLDCRFPGQAVHCQNLQLLPNGVPSRANADAFLTMPISQGGIGPWRRGAAGAGDVLVVGPGVGMRLTPTALNDFDMSSLAIVLDHRGKPALFASWAHVGDVTGTGHLAVGMHAVTTATVTNLSGQVFVGAGPKIWKFQSDLTLTYGPPTWARSLADPNKFGDGLSWSATLSLGTQQAPVQAAVAVGDQIFAGVTDGLYASDSSGTFVNVSGPLGAGVHRDNWRDLDVHNGEVVGPHSSGVYAYNPTTTGAARLRAIGPVAQSSRSPVAGRHRCVLSYGGWLYAGLWTGSASYLRAGREAAPGDWRWHTLNRLPQVAMIGRLHADGITAASAGTPLPERLWVATEPSINYGGLQGTAPIYYQPIPQHNGNPLAPSPHFTANYCVTASLYLPAFDRGAPGVKKIGETLEVWGDGLGLERYADVYYRLDDGGWRLLGRAQSSPVSSFLMGSTNGSFPVFRQMEVWLDSVCTTTATTPVYRAVVVGGKLRPDYVETIEAVVTAADGAADRRGTPMRPGATVLDDLRELADPRRRGGQPHRLIDLAGATSYVVLDGMPVESETYQEGSENPELVATVRMVVMSLSQNAG